eukprot:SAG11_NODE_4489_length_1870_cov_4.340461_2_plen_80_part_00
MAVGGGAEGGVAGSVAEDEEWLLAVKELLEPLLATLSGSGGSESGAQLAARRAEDDFSGALVGRGTSALLEYIAKTPEW